MKKFISMLIVILLLYSICIANVYAEDEFYSRGFSYDLIDGKAVITGYSLDTEILYVPEVLDGYKVSAIGDRAFDNNSCITRVVIADGIESIGAYSFYNCVNLTSVTVGNSDAVIGERAFCYKPVYKDGEYWADNTVDRSNFTFYGFPYSTLYRYADKYRYTYVAFGSSSLLGDPDLNNTVNIKDATLIQKHLAKLEPFVNRQKLYSDINYDKSITIQDATAIQKYVAGIEYDVDTRRVYVEVPVFWNESNISLMCTATGYLRDRFFQTKYDEEKGMFYADIPVIMNNMEISSDYEAEVYSNLIHIPDESTIYVKYISHENYGLWTQYEWEIV